MYFPIYSYVLVPVTYNKAVILLFLNIFFVLEVMNYKKEINFNGKDLYIITAPSISDGGKSLRLSLNTRTVIYIQACMHTYTYPCISYCLWLFLVNETIPILETINSLYIDGFQEIWGNKFKGLKNFLSRIHIHYCLINEWGFWILLLLKKIYFSLYVIGLSTVHSYMHEYMQTSTVHSYMHEYMQTSTVHSYMNTCRLQLYTATCMNTCTPQLYTATWIHADLNCTQLHEYMHTSTVHSYMNTCTPQLYTATRIHAEFNCTQLHEYMHTSTVHSYINTCTPQLYTATWIHADLNCTQLHKYMHTSTVHSYMNTCRLQLST